MDHLLNNKEYKESQKTQNKTRSRKYLVRIELHISRKAEGITDDQINNAYNSIRDVLQNEDKMKTKYLLDFAFSKEITHKGITFLLPDAEYYIQTGHTLDKIKKAVNEVCKTYLTEFDEQPLHLYSLIITQANKIHFFHPDLLKIAPPSYGFYL